MNCPVCNCEDHRVLETTPRENSIRRRRRCDRCGHTFTTFEHIADPRRQLVDVEAARDALQALEAHLRPNG